MVFVNGGSASASAYTSWVLGSMGRYSSSGGILEWNNKGPWALVLNHVLGGFLSF